VKRPLITLLTDFGLADHYVAAMKGVILGIAPEAQLVDISHEIGAHGIAEAAFTLAQAAPWFPPGTVHLVVVDPGVGSSRRPILSKAASQYFVAPDNGVLTLVWESDPKARAWEIPLSARRFGQLSRTFHGRDLFAPVAAQLALGARPGRLGRRVDDCKRLTIGAASRTGPKSWTGQILKIDRFGNAITSFPSSLWEQIAKKPFVLKTSGQAIGQAREAYAEGLPGELFIIPGSTGFLEIATNRANAAVLIGAAPGAKVDIKIS
jgi:S-adenosylmethionine hydrolase